MTRTMDQEWNRIAPISFYLEQPSETASSTLRREYLHDRPLRNDSETVRGLGKLYSDAVIGFGAHTLVNALGVYSSTPTYYYEFAHVGKHSHYEDPDTKKPVGAAHHDDLIYLFTINATFPLIAPDDNNKDSKMVDLMTDMWEHFAKHGTPQTPSLTVTWPQFAPSSRRYLRVAPPPAVKQKLFEDRFHVWERLYNTPHCTHCTL